MIDGHLDDETYLSPLTRQHKREDMSGRIYSIPAESTESFVESIDRVEASNANSIVFISRYPASRLIDLLDISEIQCYWLTNSEEKGVLEPSLEKLNHFTESLISSEQGHLFIEGIEWLVSIHGLRPFIPCYDRWLKK